MGVFSKISLVVCEMFICIKIKDFMEKTLRNIFYVQKIFFVVLYVHANVLFLKKNNNKKVCMALKILLNGSALF